jgi:hypothetical protein
MMSKLLTFVLVASVCSAVAADGLLSLAEARAKIGDAVVNPAMMTSTMKQLSAADQKAFLADCNEAISKMPGSGETKAASYLNVNRAALKGAAKGNVASLIAEVFATVPPEALTVINERFAADLFNRAADPSAVYTDEQFANIAETVMTSVKNRTTQTDGAAVRNVFAVLMLLRASNGTPADLAQKLVSSLPAETQKVALEEWIPSAMSEERNYDPMLGVVDAGEQPNASLVLQIAGPQSLDALLADINAGGVGPDAAKAATFQNASDVVTTLHVATPDIGLDAGLDRRPFYYREPDGYQWQTIGARRKR